VPEGSPPGSGIQLYDVDIQKIVPKIWELDLSLDLIKKKAPENISEAIRCDPAGRRTILSVCSPIL